MAVMTKWEKYSEQLVLWFLSSPAMVTIARSPLSNGDSAIESRVHYCPVNSVFYLYIHLGKTAMPHIKEKQDWTLQLSLVTLDLTLCYILLLRELSVGGFFRLLHSLGEGMSVSTFIAFLLLKIRTSPSQRHRPLISPFNNLKQRGGWEKRQERRESHQGYPKFRAHQSSES